MRRPAAIALAAATFAATGGIARGNPVDAFSFGARAPALAGAQTAASTDGGANYYNPALLAWQDDVRIDLGYRDARPALELDGGDLGVDGSRGLSAALSAPGKVGPIELAIGGALFLPDAHATRIRHLQPGQPRFSLYDNRPQRLFIAASLAARIGDRVAIGGGVGYMAETTGGAHMVGRLGFPDAEASDLILAVDADVAPVQYPQAGVAVKLTDWLTAGASYRGGFTLAVDITLSIAADIGVEGLDPIVEDGYLLVDSRARDLFQPAQWSAGLAAQLTPRLLVAFDLTYARWSTYQNPASRVTVELDAGRFNELFEIPPPRRLADPHFHDILIPRLGAEFALGGGDRELALRGGYAYERSPAPEQIGRDNFVDNDKHTASAGVGLTLRRWSSIVRGPLALDGYVAYTALVARTHHKLAAADRVGDYTADGRVIAAGVSSTWRF